ncbi:glutathione S-transferase [Roseobacter sinensis]|uniref:Glutathione S-transferase n=1 Tax=Roseobacter sinensis TaxID=2931391 RepID=A0ABT3BL25_9RHOB|nr:glutathione S-transferase [Roseobacter sp. WL0113]MCV3274276.1 glutathione S-transferase [Roseobacter sp. WL0113]
MTTLYTMAGTCALAPNIAAAWLDAPIEVRNLERGDHTKPNFLAINPRAQVPAVQFDDGDTLTEAAAILTWLRNTYGATDNAQLKRKEAEALSYMTSEVHAAYGPHFAPQRFADSDDARSDIQAKAYEKLASHYERLMQTLEENGGDWYLGERSLADPYLYVLTRWIDLTPLSIDDYPALKAFRERLEKDEDVLSALERQDMEPLT